jgi:ATP-dependent Clp protease ATP-binding subunit ClpA
VHITDRALVVAAELSDRYISSRFLPDKVRTALDCWRDAAFCGTPGVLSLQHAPCSDDACRTYLLLTHSQTCARSATRTYARHPHQAIDLVDEACSNVRVQLDSKPENIDSLERQRIRLQVEEQALRKEKDA